MFFDSLFSQNTNTRLRGLALNFCLTIIRKYVPCLLCFRINLYSTNQESLCFFFSFLDSVNPSLLSHVAHVLLSGLLKLLAEGEPSLKGQTYNVIGHLAIFFPGLVNKDLLLLTNFLESLGNVSQKSC